MGTQQASPPSGRCRDEITGLTWMPGLRMAIIGPEQFTAWSSGPSRSPQQPSGVRVTKAHTPWRPLVLEDPDQEAESRDTHQLSRRACLNTQPLYPVAARSVCDPTPDAICICAIPRARLCTFPWHRLQRTAPRLLSYPLQFFADVVQATDIHIPLSCSLVGGYTWLLVTAPSKTYRRWRSVSSMIADVEWRSLSSSTILENNGYVISRGIHPRKTSSISIWAMLGMYRIGIPKGSRCARMC